jgi:hypothetical protein
LSGFVVYIPYSTIRFGLFCYQTFSNSVFPAWKKIPLDTINPGGTGDSGHVPFSSLPTTTKPIANFSKKILAKLALYRVFGRSKQETIPFVKGNMCHLFSVPSLQFIINNGTVAGWDKHAERSDFASKAAWPPSSESRSRIENFMFQDHA